MKTHKNDLLLWNVIIWCYNENQEWLKSSPHYKFWQWRHWKYASLQWGNYFFKVVEDIWEDRPVHRMYFKVINRPETLFNSSLLGTLSVTLSQSVVFSSWTALLHLCSLPSGAWPLPLIYLHTVHIDMKMSLLLGLQCADIKTALFTSLLVKDWNFPLKLLLQLKFWLLEIKTSFCWYKGSTLSEVNVIFT